MVDLFVVCRHDQRDRNLQARVDLGQRFERARLHAARKLPESEHVEREIARVQTARNRGARSTGRRRRRAPSVQPHLGADLCQRIVAQIRCSGSPRADRGLRVPRQAPRTSACAARCGPTTRRSDSRLSKSRHVLAQADPAERRSRLDAYLAIARLRSRPRTIPRSSGSSSTRKQAVMTSRSSVS